jgi:hypothetical protein
MHVCDWLTECMRRKKFLQRATAHFSVAKHKRTYRGRFLFLEFQFLMCFVRTHRCRAQEKCIECGVNKKIALEPIFSLFRALVWSRDAWKIFLRECLKFNFFLFSYIPSSLHHQFFPSSRIHKRFRQEKNNAVDPLLLCYSLCARSLFLVCWKKEFYSKWSHPQVDPSHRTKNIHFKLLFDRLDKHPRIENTGSESTCFRVCEKKV